jgi:tetratricopeptide (TPR) repeat protein
MRKFNTLILLGICLCFASTTFADLVIAQTLLRQKKYSEAREEFQKSLPGLKGEEAAKIQLTIASTYARESKFLEARQEYEKVLQIEGATDDQKSQALLEIGGFFWRYERNNEGAKEAFEKIVAMEKASAVLRGRGQLGIATVFWIEKNTAETIKAALKAQEIEGTGQATKHFAILYIARAQKLDKNYKDALENYLKFIPNEKRIGYKTEAILATGEIYLAQSEYEKSREAFATVLATKEAGVSNNAKSNAHFNTAQSYFAEKNSEKALEEFKKLLEAPYVTASHKRTAETRIKQLEKK